MALALVIFRWLEGSWFGVKSVGGRVTGGAHAQMQHARRSGNYEGLGVRERYSGTEA